jgi:hypothetical protein
VSGQCDAVKEAKTARRAIVGVVTGRAHNGKAICKAAGHDHRNQVDQAADRQAGRFERVAVEKRVSVDVLARARFFCALLEALGHVIKRAEFLQGLGAARLDELLGRGQTCRHSHTACEYTRRLEQGKRAADALGSLQVRHVIFMQQAALIVYNARTTSARVVLPDNARLGELICKRISWV